MNAKTKTALRLAVRKHFRESGLFPPSLDRLVFQASTDLWSGPLLPSEIEGDAELEGYPGWDVASERLVELRSLVPGMYYDSASETLHIAPPEERWLDTDADPEEEDWDLEAGGVWRETDLSSWYHLSREEVFAALVGPDIPKNL